MAVTLPTITIQDDAIAAIVIDTFSGEVDDQGNALSPQTAYRRWLRGQLIEKVSYKRSQAKRAAREAADLLDLESERSRLDSI